MKKIMLIFIVVTMMISNLSILTFASDENDVYVSDEGTLFTSDRYAFTVLSDNTIEIIGYFGEDTDITIPSEIGNSKVTSIGPGAFSASHWMMENGMVINVTKVTNVIIPDGVINISDNAFMYCIAESISIPDSVQYIGGNAFYNCFKLKAINIPQGITSIFGFTFNCCGSLTELKIPESVEYIGVAAFQQCKGLKDITIYNKEIELGEGVFSGSDSLTINSYADSNAHMYAHENDISFKSIDELTYGDVNGDSSINSKDSLLLNQYNANYDVEIDTNACDVYFDRKINSKDNLLLKQYIANWEVALG